MGSSVNLAAEAASSQPAKKTAAKEAANKAPTAEEKRVKELLKDSDDTYVMYYKLNFRSLRGRKQGFLTAFVTGRAFIDSI
ncbi:hypothetical protein LQV63_30115 [Paenibacillus profundus]|uniref:Uncharacterized protein n=1 Tax=Paenibacillus profundus TaxID=1173085 RepID=A0ABS8YRA4_9BACL|nr:hypothetical protein [Paenibacillus profundus]MCE5173494.1 hypothetical protein [Paenibacillus profundus]